jgi:predicted nucleic acid-binding protein
MTYLLDTNAISDLMRAAPRIENWMASLGEDDRVITCTIVRGEILFGIAKLPEGRRRTELEQTGHQFLASLRCEPVPEPAAMLTPPLSLPGNNAASRWMKTTFGSLRRHSHWVQH